MKNTLERIDNLSSKLAGLTDLIWISMDNIVKHDHNPFSDKAAYGIAELMSGLTDEAEAIGIDLRETA